MKNFLFILIVVIIVARLGFLTNTDDDNLYTIHTKTGNIQCNYHNSRDLNNGWMEYIDHKTKESVYIEFWKIDSITIHSENAWTCGPKDEKLKYILLNDQTDN